ncbi:MAG: hypothetical protein LBU62_03800 [Bacteroidales bacterium]|jgi:hypothetical protein|nr:hypothetical protein [Bacteroidales bacterium]
MKNQYVGDINDYQKYDLLQMLTETLQMKMLVVWRLTSDDGGPDGKRTTYLNNPKKYRNLNPGLFEELQSIVRGNNRRITAIQEFPPFCDSGIFDFFTDNIESTDREEYFKKVQKKLTDAGIVFFDPDNGLETKTKNKTTASKHLYWHEIQEVWNQNKNVLFIQFYTREKRIDYTERKITECATKLSIPRENIVPFYGKYAVFFLLLHCADKKDELLYKWGKWETGKQNIMAEDGKKYFYGICRDPSWSIGWGISTVPIFNKIYSHLYYINENDISDANDYKDLVGHYYDKDGYIYYANNNEIMRLFFPESWKIKYFEKLYERKINST